MSTPTATHIEFEDMQGLARFGHGHLADSLFLLVAINDAVAARTWLRQAPVSSAEIQAERPDHVLQIAFSAAGLRAIGVSDELVNGFSPEFLEGMAGSSNRSRRLGDYGSNDPARWHWGQPQSPVIHLLLMLYANEGQMDSWRQEIENSVFSRAFGLLYELSGTLHSHREPFGFIDGISQPDIDWHSSVTRGGRNRVKYDNALAAGEVMLGYKNEYGLYTDRPLVNLDEEPRGIALPRAEELPEQGDLGRNGSYLVLRELEQDVAGFWGFLDSVAHGDSDKREAIASAMVGRTREGEALVSGAGLNDFDYDQDPFGRQCPLGAHVRRANPRSGDFPAGTSGLLSQLIRLLGFKRNHPRDDLIASARFHRLLRRGRPYGPCRAKSAPQAVAPDSGGAGLLFVCLGANISRQFEFVQNAWLASNKFAGLSGESDPLLGNREPLSGNQATDAFSIAGTNAPATCIHALPQFVQLRGGGYFFMPGIRALAFIAEAGN